MREVVIDVSGDEPMTPWGPVGGPPRVRAGEVTGMDPVFLTTPDVLMGCFDPGGAIVDGIRGRASRDGFLTLESHEGVWVYELFPAVWSDDEWRNNPAVYVAVWPD